MKVRRLFDVETAEKLNTLHAHAFDAGMHLNLDFCSLREQKYTWILQVFDDADRVVVTGRGRTLKDAVAETLDRWLARNASGRVKC